VLGAISRLPPKSAVAVMMRVLEEQPYPVIAEALGCAETTARIHVMRGRARLCRMLAHLAPRQRDEGGAE
jgi:DNA-directed RNA polymerase specialized sigma24 family protein